MTDKNINVEANELSFFLEELNLDFKPKTKKNWGKLSELEKDIKYQIKEISKTNGQYGEKMEITLEYKKLGSTLETTVNLPDRYNKMSEEQIKVLVGKPDVFFKYIGKNKNQHHEILFTQ